LSDDDYDHTGISRDMPRLQRFLSPEDAVPDRRDRERTQYHHHVTSDERPERRRSRSREPESRSRSNRPGASPDRRPPVNRTESNARYDEKPRRSYKDASPDRSYSRKVDPATVRTTSYRNPNVSKYGGSYDDYHPGHRSVRESKRSPAMSTT